MMKSIFISSLENELAIDLVVWNNLNDQPFPEGELILPRPFKTGKIRAKLFSTRLNFLVYLLYYLWFIAVYPPLMFAKMVLALFRLLKRRIGGPRHRRIAPGAKVAIVSSVYAEQLFLSKEFESYIKIDLFKTGGENEQINIIYDFLTFGNILTAWYCSMAVIFKEWSMLKGNLRFQTAFSFEWWLFYIFLKGKVASIDEVVYTNHYDRWAILLDRLHFRKTTLFQHGLIGGVKLPTRLINIDEIWCYDKASETVFIREIVANPDTRYNIRKRGINLVNVEGYDGVKKILLIGTPFNQEKELLVLSRIMEKYKGKVHILIKPHPVYSSVIYEDFSKKNQVTLIVEANMFPLVDLTISYKSTLAFQYAEENIGNVSLELTEDEIIQEVDKILLN